MPVFLRNALGVQEFLALPVFRGVEVGRGSADVDADCQRRTCGIHGVKDHLIFTAADGRRDDERQLALFIEVDLLLIEALKLRLPFRWFL